MHIIYLSQLLRPIAYLLGIDFRFIKPILSGIIELTNGINMVANISIKSISQNIVQPNNIKSGLPESTGNELNKLVKNDEVKRVKATIDKYVTKNAIHNNLVKILGERGKEI